MTYHLNPLATAKREYPFAKLMDLKRQREEAGHRVIDFGVGDPRDPTPAFIRQALADGIPEVSSYPSVPGERELRESFCDYHQRRFGIALDPDQHVVPVNGTKEALFTTPLALLNPRGSRRTVITFEPAYPVYAAGARYAGGEVAPQTLRADRQFTPSAEDLDPELLDRTAMLWLNSPHNPTGAVLDEQELARFVELGRQHEFIVCSDECYADVYFGAPPATALAVAGAPHFRNVLAYHSCSKRSCMTGYRSGFIAGDPDLIAVLKRFRPAVGVATPHFVQAAARAAWSDDAHVAGLRGAYAARREVFLDLFERQGWIHAGGDATFYLWWRVPDRTTKPTAAEAEQTPSIAFAERLLDENLLVTPGSYLGLGGDEYVRLSLVATLEDSKEAVARLEKLTW